MTGNRHGQATGRKQDSYYYLDPSPRVSVNLANLPARRDKCNKPPAREAWNYQITGAHDRLCITENPAVTVTYSAHDGTAL